MSWKNVQYENGRFKTSNGGGGGSTVSFTQTLTSGTESGTITIDGVDTKIYAPTPINIGLSIVDGKICQTYGTE